MGRIRKQIDAPASSRHYGLPIQLFILCRRNRRKTKKDEKEIEKMRFVPGQNKADHKHMHQHLLGNFHVVNYIQLYILSRKQQEKTRKVEKEQGERRKKMIGLEGNKKKGTRRYALL